MWSWGLCHSSWLLRGPCHHHPDPLDPDHAGHVRGHGLQPGEEALRGQGGHPQLARQEPGQPGVHRKCSWCSQSSQVKNIPLHWPRLQWMLCPCSSRWKLPFLLEVLGMYITEISMQFSTRYCVSWSLSWPWKVSRCDDCEDTSHPKLLPAQIWEGVSSNYLISTRQQLPTLGKLFSQWTTCFSNIHPD